VIHFIEVANRPEFPDPHARGLPAEAATHGWPGLRAAAFARVYLVEGDLGPAEAERIAREVLADPLVERASVGQPLPFPEFAAATPVLITRRSGVMDPVEESALKAIADLGLRARRVRTARKYRFLGDLAPAALRAFVERALANPVVEEILWGEERPPLRPVEARERSDRGTVPLASAGSASPPPRCAPSATSSAGSRGRRPRPNCSRSPRPGPSTASTRRSARASTSTGAASRTCSRTP
jgi:phosphoribosylformylglycinamidine (FGAM) synthase PurS component